MPDEKRLITDDEAEKIARDMMDAKDRVLQRIGLSENFWFALKFEPSDWGFAVKCGALCEAVVNDRLRLSLPDTLAERAARDLTHSQRLRWLRALGVVDASALQTIEAITSLRNEVVHDVRQAESFTLQSYCHRLNAESPPSRLDRLLTLLGWSNTKTRRELGASLFLEGKREFFWLPLMMALGLVDISYRLHDNWATGAAEREALIEALLGPE